ncbi:uncharacterized protein LOC110696988 [Chenopodium quinoa]|uniref:uncharacterized protein LOC110696988 n=1 Tax=Chenopodium quinoa TaxID=63459 RepID=UPI000B776978|nr:uncharacterized protein LOC110696988 [Chenopodium quinoa]
MAFAVTDVYEESLKALPSLSPCKYPPNTNPGSPTKAPAMTEFQGPPIDLRRRFCSLFLSPLTVTNQQPSPVCMLDDRRFSACWMIGDSLPCLALPFVPPNWLTSTYVKPPFPI